MAHGWMNEGMPNILALNLTYNDAGFAACTAWRNAANGVGNQYMQVGRRIIWINGVSTRVWGVLVFGTWFELYAQPHTTENDSIVFACSCLSAEEGNFTQSLLSSIGGRVGFGFVYGSTYGSICNDVKLLLKRMNGRDPYSTDLDRRYADVAFNYGGYSSYFRMYPSTPPPTTLCPAIVSTYIFGGWVVPNYVYCVHNMHTVDSVCSATDDRFYELDPQCTTGSFFERKNVSGSMVYSWVYYYIPEYLRPFALVYLNGDYIKAPGGQSCDVDAIAPNGGKLGDYFLFPWY